MTSKERAKLRAAANSLEPIFQIGKDGVSANLLSQLSDALEARELIKVKVHLETAPQTPRQFANEAALALNADIVQVIGGVIVLYRKSEKLEKERTAKKKLAYNSAKTPAKRAAKGGKDRAKHENSNFRRGV